MPARRPIPKQEIFHTRFAPVLTSNRLGLRPIRLDLSRCRYGPYCPLSIAATLFVWSVLKVACETVAECGSSRFVSPPIGSVRRSQVWSQPRRLNICGNVYSWHRLRGMRTAVDVESTDANYGGN